MTVDTILKAMAGVLAFRVGQITGNTERLEQFIGYINDAMTTIADYGDWSFLNVRTSLTTVADQEYIELPADFDAFQSNSEPYYDDASSYPLSHASAEEIDRRKRWATSTTGRALLYTPYFSSADAGGEPRHRLLLWPTPDAAYSITLPYRRVLPRLSAATDVPQIPVGMHEVLRTLAMAEAEEQYEKVAQGSQRPKAMARLVQAWERFGSPMRGQARMKMSSWNNRDRRGGLDEGIDPIVVTTATPP